MLSIWSHPNFCHLVKVNHLPNNKSLALPNLKAFADDNIKVTEKFKFVLERLQNVVGKGEYGDYQHFILSYNVFKRHHPQGR